VTAFVGDTARRTLGEPVAAASSDAAPAVGKPRDVIAAAGEALARGRLDGFYKRQ